MDKLVKVPVSKISRFKDQPRKYFNQRTLQDLAMSIMKDGQQVPVSVIEDPANLGCYILIDGERRWRAFNYIKEYYNQELMVSAIVKPVSDVGKHFEASFISNLHRDDMTPLDIAHSISVLKSRNYTWKKIAEMMGKSPLHVMNYYKLNNLPEKVKDMMSLDLPKKKRLNVTLAIEIVNSTNDPEIMEEIANSIIAHSMTLNETRYYISKKYDSKRIYNLTDEQYENKNYISKSYIRVNGKDQDPAKEYNKLVGMISRFHREFDIFNKSIDLEILLGFKDFPEQEAKDLSQKLLALMLRVNQVKEKLDAIAGSHK